MWDGGVTTNTMSRWIRISLKEFGVETSVFNAHSTRGAVAAKASASGGLNLKGRPLENGIHFQDILQKNISAPTCSGNFPAEAPGFLLFKENVV